MKKYPDIFPLGDAAVTIELGDQIEEFVNNQVISMQDWFREHPFTGLKDCIPAYASLTLFYDPFIVYHCYQPDTTIAEWVSKLLDEAFRQCSGNPGKPTREHRIPVCYDTAFGPDLAFLASARQLNVEEVIQFHTTRSYRVFMIGFLPGFSYLGPVHQHIELGRKAQPVQVLPGSVGIAGAQTGIYPVNSPGGWHIIGRTPVKLFDPHAQDPVLLKTGDQVTFYPITASEFHEFSSSRLSTADGQP
ncbi:MAG: 5-oxoprolinase subunit PxpB [Candidatus Pseudobacter hemicellulosilyticus]|uniref:5-oxoprolinase subunit PxpB n=1 Tax=Candidatus Pseudobacter hemicellulosilyticus TaxID=3121375 RepID=A0AAJ5WQV1_9BACT|nr:MAG: 5-oxoprolinase subunit PxpB [Pseudobacter sp.]